MLLTTLSLLGAFAIAAGGFLSSSRAAGDLEQLVTPPAPTSEATAARPSLAGTPRAAGENAAAQMRSVLPVNEQAFEATRQDAVMITQEAPVRAARAVGPGTPALAPGDRVKASVSFYYCEIGTKTAAQGDGGGFCGAMRDGSVVYDGAAACDYVYLGQHFRIEGDPLKRVYRCADTGSAVHGLHRDVWFSSSDEGWAWQRAVGQSVNIEVLP